MSRSLFGPGTLVLGGGAALLLVFLFVGYLLPADWEARAEGVVLSAPEDVLPYLDSPEGWQSWTPWPDSLERTGPERGAGAGIAWSSRDLGRGSFLVESASLDGVSYVVRVEGAGDAVMETRGTVRLVAEGRGTRLVWHEEGDLGRNPLMGYWALSMDRAQSEELAKSIRRLADLVASAEEVGSTSAEPVRPDSVPSR